MIFHTCHIIPKNTLVLRNVSRAPCYEALVGNVHRMGNLALARLDPNDATPIDASTTLLRPVPPEPRRQHLPRKC